MSGLERWWELSEPADIEKAGQSPSHETELEDADPTGDELVDDPWIPASYEEHSEAVDTLDPGEDSQAPVGEHMAATFDVLSLTALLRDVGPATEVDLHVFAYLACLMSLYDGEPAAAWGYPFSAVPPTLPYSASLASSLARATGAQLVSAREEGTVIFLEPTAAGSDLLGGMSSLRIIGDRVKYLEASAGTALLHSLSTVVNSVAGETDLSASIGSGTPRLLLGRRSSSSIYTQFKLLSSALGEVESDLLIPASVYVRYLTERFRQDIGGQQERLDE